MAKTAHASTGRKPRTLKPKANKGARCAIDKKHGDKFRSQFEIERNGPKVPRTEADGAKKPKRQGPRQRVREARGMAALFEGVEMVVAVEALGLLRPAEPATSLPSVLRESIAVFDASVSPKLRTLRITKNQPHVDFEWGTSDC